MKTTVDIADALLASAKQAAARERTTVRALIEEGLRLALQRRRKPAPFTLRDASFKGEGVQPDVNLGDWDAVTAMTYAGRGG
jgi:hypothetical protein